MIKLWAKIKTIGAGGNDSAQLQAIYSCASGGQVMQSQASVQVLSGLGISGDRYATHQGHWHRVESCQVTLITEDELRRIEKRSGIPVSEGQHRRNLVVSGITRKQLENRQFQIGDVHFAYHKPRPPCGYLDQVAGQGLAKAMGLDCGACIKVLSDGVMKVGDRLIVGERLKK